MNRNEHEDRDVDPFGWALCPCCAPTRFRRLNRHKIRAKWRRRLRVIRDDDWWYE